jgi:hypothetical protein
LIEFFFPKRTCNAQGQTVWVPDTDDGFTLGTFVNRADDISVVRVKNADVVRLIASSFFLFSTLSTKKKNLPQAVFIFFIGFTKLKNGFSNFLLVFPSSHVFSSFLRTPSRHKLIDPLCMHTALQVAHGVSSQSTLASRSTRQHNTHVSSRSSLA